MICNIITTLYSAVLIVLGFLYLVHRYKLKDKGIRRLIKENIKYILLTFIVFVLVTVVQFIYTIDMDTDKLSVLLKWSTLIWGLYIIAKVDFHEKKIPNKIILAMAIIRIIFLGYEICSNIEYWKEAISYPLIGAAVGGIILAVAMFISRRGIGMGDVKMFMIIGGFVGSTEIISALFYTFLVSAIIGIILLATKKAKLKDSIPMAPFAFVGIVVEYILLLVGG